MARTRLRPTIALLLAVALMTAACGTRLSDERLRAGATLAGALETASEGSGDDAVPADGIGVTGVDGGTTTGGDTGTAPGSGGPAASSGAATGAAASSGTATGGPATGSEVTVGVVGTFSGPVGAFVSDIAKAIQIWGQYINQNGGVNGHRVRVVVADDGGDPARYNSLLRQLVEQDHAIAMIMTTLGFAGSGNNAYLNGKQVMTFGTEGGFDNSYSDPFLPTPIPVGHAYAETLNYSIAGFAKAQGKTKAASLACSDFSLCDNFDQTWNSSEMQANTGTQVVYRARPSLTQPDFTAECLAAKQKGAEFFLLGLDTASVQRLAASCARQNYRPIFGVADLLALPVLQSDPNLQGSVVGTKLAPWVDLGVPGFKQMSEAFARYAPGVTPSGSSAAGWAFASLFAEAAKNLPADPTPADVVKGVGQIKENTLNGMTYPLTFTAGQPQPRKVCWGTVLIKDNKYQPGDKLTCK